MNVGTKFEIVSGLLLTKLSVFYESEVELTAMIDTGSAGTAVDIDKFPFDPMRAASRIVSLVGIGGRQEVIAQFVAGVEIGKQRVLDYEIQFCDLWERFQFEAIIGSDLLERLGATIDYPNREIRFGGHRLRCRSS